MMKRIPFLSSWFGSCWLLCLLTLACGQDLPTDLPILGFVEVNEAGDTLYHQIPDFALVDQDSNLITQELVEGKVYVADMFFTSCPTICPKMSQQMLRLHDSLLNEPRVVLISHTIDPEHDTVAVLNEYATALGIQTEKWHMLTGEKEVIYDLAAEYMVSAAEDPDAPGGFIHSGAFILVDTERRVRGFYDGTIPEKVDELLRDLRWLLDNG
ncbi:MAG: SCO family protein [Bacteroidota bacterium]